MLPFFPPMIQSDNVTDSSELFISLTFAGHGNMRRRFSVTWEALGEFGSPAALAPPSPTVSKGDVKTMGDVALIQHVLLQGGNLLFSRSMIVG